MSIMPLIEASSSAYKRKYQCPYCEEKYDRVKLVDHIEKKHSEFIPKDFTASRIVFNIVNKKEKGKCTICGKESPWDEDKCRYDRFCSDKCKKAYEQLAAERLKRVRGMTKQEMLKDPEYQNNVMLANRSISGKYKFQDGTIRTYVGSYELKFLEFMDKFLNVKSEDLETPGPIIEYKFKGETHKWITDAYYAPYNLVFDIKDGGDNPNKREMPEYRAKQTAKESAIKKQGKYNYIRLTDNKFEQLIELMFELKELYIENNGEYTPIVRINESYIIDEIDKGDNNMIHEAKESTLQNILELNMKLNLFEYGLPVNGKITDVKSSKYWDDNYKTMSVSEFEKYKGGICWDYVFYQDYILNKMGIQHTNYYIISSNYQTHIITVVKDSGKLYYIESSFKRICGVYPASNINDILFFVIKKMGIPDYYVFKINSFPKVHSTSNEYMQFMEDKGTFIMKGKSDSIKDIKLDNIQKSFEFPKDKRSIKEFSIITPCSDKPSQEGFIGRGSWNAVKRIDGEPYRERVEVIIFNKDLDKILIGTDSDKIKLPGGGTDKNSSLEAQAAKECQEEVRINIDNLKYIGAYSMTNDQSGIKNDVYKGHYTYLYLATYESDYTGYIRPEDTDSLYDTGKWTDIYTAKELFKKRSVDLYNLFNYNYKLYINDLSYLKL